MGHPAENIDHKYNYGDYLTWPEGERCELIDGYVYNMSPAPLRIHQEILTILTSGFYDFFKDKTCKVYVDPFDVRLPKGDLFPGLKFDLSEIFKGLEGEDF